MSGLQQRVALVTGSSSGIGEAVARALAGQGARVVINSSSSTAAGEAVAASLPEAVYIQASVATATGAERLVEAAAARWGHLDIVVNNAGTTERIPHADLDAATDEVWQRILQTNLMGTWWVSRAAVPHLRAAGGGCIVNITSLAGVRPSGSSIPYAVSKAAINHLTRLMAKSLGPDVRVNAVAPGLIRTPWTEDWEDLHTAVAGLAPLRRSGDPDDVAAMVVALAASDYTTGEVVVVDGGLNLFGA
jgi:ketoreductase RED2